MNSEAYINIDDCVDNHIYEIRSRNLTYGVYSANDHSFTGVREKFGSRFLFDEFHWDTGPPFGTVKPVEIISELPADIKTKKDLFEFLDGFERPTT